MEKQNKTVISILGCGWLSLPLATNLIQKGHAVKGSTTSENKLAVLKSQGIIAYLIALRESKILGDVAAFLEGSSIAIIAIPPKVRGGEKENFVAKMTALLPYIEATDIEKVLLISSTSVFPDTPEVISEETEPQPDSESGKQLLQVEQLFKNNKKFQTTIVRFGGLIGEDRHPVVFLSGRKNIANPEAPINLIHRVDCIGIIERIIENDIWNETFNAVTPFHPTRKEYYTQKAKGLGIPIPEFASDTISIGKTINSSKIGSRLQYEFVVKSL